MSLADKAIIRGFHTYPNEIEHLTVTGTGHVRVRWDLESPTFSPGTGELALRVDPPGNVMNASGRVVLDQVAEDALCQGSAHSPLVVTHIGKVDGAELERIDIYGLSVGDVRRLQPAARVIPWIPHALEARKLEHLMRLGTDNAKLQAERRADFWTKLAAILSTQQVLGSTQSNVRLASMRARREALSWGRERFWLSVFSLIGYGERITLPLLWWLGGVVLAGLAHAAVVPIPSGIASRQLAELLVRLALGPLAFLRVDELRPPNAPGPWDTVIWIAALILGTVCLGLPWLRSAGSPEPHTDQRGRPGSPVDHNPALGRVMISLASSPDRPPRRSNPRPGQSTVSLIGPSTASKSSPSSGGGSRGEAASLPPRWLASSSP